MKLFFVSRSGDALCLDVASDTTNLFSKSKRLSTTVVRFDFLNIQLGQLGSISEHRFIYTGSLW